MKIANSVALSLFLASGANGFGTGRPMDASAFGMSRTSSRRGDMTMRTGVYDVVRRQKFNNILKTVQTDPSKEKVETELLSSETSELIKKCNWKLRKAMIRKVRNVAVKYDVELDSSFGKAPTQAEREALEQEAKAARIASAVFTVVDEAEPAAEPVIEETPEPEAPKAEAAPAAAPAAASGNEVTPKTIKALRDLTGAGMINWKLRKAMIRKVRNVAVKYDVVLDPSFGKAPTQAEREALEQGAKAALSM
eukprot:CAMPEP_0172518272 /NCGR_PEP_ID=MMETSP1066-20121228/290716_1 /TAXON_ID=671091 /ORGANISM="Coscinodiscus wailesii, Strain CCMP2513" /LENGTH=250 /DNA_ID=CAMNT_0013300623 /DNA_START=110 /DNA_END=862 /DNA_ORIENTATION=+